MKAALCLLLLAGIAVASSRVPSFYKTVRVNQSVVGISCPGNGGDPTVIGNVNGTLLIYCGTEKP